MMTRLLPRVWAGAVALVFAAPPLFHAQDLKSFEQRITTKVLPNGLTILVCERPEAPVPHLLYLECQPLDRQEHRPPWHHLCAMKWVPAN